MVLALFPTSASRGSVASRFGFAARFGAVPVFIDSILRQDAEEDKGTDVHGRSAAGRNPQTNCADYGTEASGGKSFLKGLSGERGEGSREQNLALVAANVRRLISSVPQTCTLLRQLHRL